MFRVTKKLSNVNCMIKVWNKMDFSHISQDKEEISNKLSSIRDIIQQDGYNDQNKNIEMSILTDLHNIISREENFQKQRSRINWLKEGDQNTKFYHLYTLNHRANNRISGIKKGQSIFK